MSINVVCIIQARLNSTRLPQKILKKLPYNSECSVLDQVISRIKQSKKIQTIVIATTTHSDDDLIVEKAKKQGVHVFRGSEDDVLSRYFKAGKQFFADVVVRITSDCPCIDFDVVDAMIEKFCEETLDYMSNSLEKTFPHGLDCEVFTMKALEIAYKNATLLEEKEHVTPYFYKTHRADFKIKNFSAKASQNSADIRITLDTEADYTLLCVVFEALYDKNPYFLAEDICAYFTKYPYLKEINRSVEQKKVCVNLKEELSVLENFSIKQDLNRAKDYLKTVMKSLD